MLSTNRLRWVAISLSALFCLANGVRDVQAEVDPIVGYLVLDGQSFTDSDPLTTGSGFPQLYRLDADLNVVWQVGKKIDFNTGLLIPESEDPTSIQFRSARSLTFGTDGYVYVNSNGTDNLLDRVNFDTGLRDSTSGWIVAAENPSGSTMMHGGVHASVFGPDLNGNGTRDLYVSRRSGFEVHDVLGKTKAELTGNAGAIDLTLLNPLATTITASNMEGDPLYSWSRINWETYGADLPSFDPAVLDPLSIGAPISASDAWGTDMAFGPDANNDGVEDLYVIFGDNNNGSSNPFGYDLSPLNYVAILSGPNPNDANAIPFEVIDIIKDDHNRRGTGIAFDDDDNMYVTGGSTTGETFNVHVNNGSGPVDHENMSGEPDFLSIEAARFVKTDGEPFDYRPDNPSNVRYGKDGKLYISSRFGHKADDNAAMGNDGDGPGMALVYEIDPLSADPESLGEPTVLIQGDNPSGPGLYLPGNRVYDIIPIFASDLEGPSVLVGDYNSDGMVDAADYTVWRDSLGTATDLPNRDPNNMGNVASADYDSWVAHFGESLSESAATSVPEPASALLAVFAVAALGVGRRRGA